MGNLPKFGYMRQELVEADNHWGKWEGYNTVLRVVSLFCGNWVRDVLPWGAVGRYVLPPYPKVAAFRHMDQWPTFLSVISLDEPQKTVLQDNAIAYIWNYHFRTGTGKSSSTSGSTPWSVQWWQGGILITWHEHPPQSDGQSYCRSEFICYLD